MTCLNKMDTPASLDSRMMDGDTQKEEIALINPACVLARCFGFFSFSFFFDSVLKALPEMY